MTRKINTELLITRPLGQHERFRDACVELGLQVAHLPCLIIEPLRAREASAALQRAHGAVLFTSTNAVHHAHQLRPLPWPGVDAHAIGKATAQALSTLNQSPVKAPVKPYNSESFLESLEGASAQSLLIVKGLGGRSLIQQTLQNRGWTVDSVDVYQRRRPNDDESRAASIFTHTLFDLISVSSDEILINLLALSQPWHTQILGSQLIVNSDRCAQLAKQHGFIKPALVARPAGDDGQLQCLREWLSDH